MALKDQAPERLRPRQPRLRHRVGRILLHGFATIGIASVTSSFLSQTLFKPTVTPRPPNDLFSDGDYPLRPAVEPWNISTSYPYPKRLSKQVSEGTWLRIATHPLIEEIVFDMLGDLYCMSTNEDDVAKAKPFLQGIPYEKEPEFSADGSNLVFISDAGFGVDNIWTVPYSNCEDMARKPPGLVRSTAIQQSNSTFRFFSSPAFHPTLPKLIATKWYLAGRPNGAGEIWEFPLLAKPPASLPERGGERIISRKLPSSWPDERYFESQLGVEQARFTGVNGDGVIFTRNTRDDESGKFSYNKDVHKGINSIFLLNTTTGSRNLVVDANPGGANMPRVSHDSRTLAFIRRVKEKSVLVLKDLRSGTLHFVWSELTYDVSMIPAFMGAYPNYGFSAGDKNIIIWSGGQIWKVSLKFNEMGERVAASSPRTLLFEAQIDLALAETVYSETNISIVELRDQGRVRSLRGLRASWSGENVAFEAAGDTYIMGVNNHTQTPIPKAVSTAQYYAPSFIHLTPFVLHARWSDQNLTILELVDMFRNEQVAVVGVPRGRYISPIVQYGKIAFVRTGNDYILGDVEETAQAGVWIGDINLPTSKDYSQPALVSNLRLVYSTPTGTALNPWQNVNLNFKDSSGKQFLIIQDGKSVIQYDYEKGFGQKIATGKTSVEMQISKATQSLNLWSRLSSWWPSVASSESAVVAFRDFQHVWISQVDHNSAFNLWSKPKDHFTPNGLLRLSHDGGHDVSFSTDGTKIFWLFGPHLYHASVKDLFQHCKSASFESRDSGQCAAPFIKSQEIEALYETDLGKLRNESNGTNVALINACLMSMDVSVQESVANSSVIFQNGVLVAVGAGKDIEIPVGAHVIDLAGGAILPGFVDVHGHWGGFLSQYPSASWEFETFLGYGITTIHNPSSKNVDGCAERAFVEKGAFYGPRVYHTGDVLYGSIQPNVYTEINSLADARSALLRVKIEGGDSSFSVKNYQLASRSARQRLLLEAARLNMIVMPEGGWSFDWDMTYFIDGMTTNEHPVPIPELYDDVLSLIEASGSSYTQVAVMNYGGLFGQNWVHQNHDIPEDTKLRKYVKHDILEGLTEIKKAPDHSYQFFNTTISTKKLAGRGVRTNIGAHGEQPIGFLFHSEMEMLALGGQSKYDVLRAATIGGATSLGLQSSIGSIEPGKLADLVIYPPGVDTVEKVWAASRDIKYVVRGGRMFEVEDGLVEYWPRNGRRQKGPRINPED